MPPYDVLVRDYRSLVLEIARRILGDASAAEDVTQDLFLHFLENPEALKNATNLRAFLCRSAVNKALDVRREKQRRTKREAAWAGPEESADPAEAAWWQEIRARVEDLPADERLAVDLRFFRGMTVRETAKAMQVSVGTVLNRVADALSHLRKSLGAEAYIALAAVLGANEAKAATRGVTTALILTGGMFLVMTLGPSPIGNETVPPAPAVAQVTATPASAWSAAPLAETTPQVASAWRRTGDTFVAEGFLFRDAAGLTLAEPRFQEPLRASVTPPPKTRHFCLPAERTRSAHRGPIYFVEEEGLSGLPIAASLAEPSARLVVRVERVEACGWPGEPVVVVEVLEAEFLSRSWLDAWAEMLRANAELARAFDREPGPARRAELMAAADRLLAALGAARSARQAQRFTAWRAARENEILLASSEGLRAAGVHSAGIAEWPEESDAEAIEELAAYGLELKPTDAYDRARLGLKGGAEIVSVRAGSVADRAGFRAGDIVWRAGGVELSSPWVLAGMVRRSFTVEVLRRQERLTLSLD